MVTVRLMSVTAITGTESALVRMNRNGVRAEAEPRLSLYCAHGLAMPAGRIAKES